jgi:hypothetical protein
MCRRLGADASHSARFASHVCCIGSHGYDAGKKMDAAQAIASPRFSEELAGERNRCSAFSINSGCPEKHFPKRQSRVHTEMHFGGGERQQHQCEHTVE